MTGWNLSTPESEAAYEAEYGPVPRAAMSRNRSPG